MKKKSIWLIGLTLGFVIVLLLVVPAMAPILALATVSGLSLLVLCTRQFNVMPVTFGPRRPLKTTHGIWNRVVNLISKAFFLNAAIASSDNGHNLDSTVSRLRHFWDKVNWLYGASLLAI